MGSEPPPCLHLEWDTDFFGHHIAAVVGGELDEAKWAEARAWCARERIDCLMLRAAAPDEATRAVALGAGFLEVDERVTFERSLDTDAPAADERVRPYEQGDRATLCSIARSSFTDSRYYADPGFPDESVSRMYVTWIENSCDGYADHVLVSEHEGQAAGFLTCHVKEDHGLIGLVAVATPGRGLGSALVGAGCRWFADNDRRVVRVATQGRNSAARGLYESRGFREVSREAWYHLWFEGHA